jgi:hypothetical protein
LNPAQVIKKIASHLGNGFYLVVFDCNRPSYIDLTDHRKQIYQSETFKKWLDKHFFVWGVPLEFPIGYVKNYQDVLQWINKDLKFKKIEFVN